RTRRVALVGAGRRAESGTDIVRKLATVAGLAGRQRRLARVGFMVRGQGDLAELTQAAAEGLTLAEFNAGSYKTTDPAPAPPPTWTIVVDGESENSKAGERIRDAAARGRVLGESSNLARELANEPGNTLTPREFAMRAAAIAGDAGVKVDIHDERMIAE